MSRRKSILVNCGILLLLVLQFSSSLLHVSLAFDCISGGTLAVNTFVL